MQKLFLFLTLIASLFFVTSAYAAEDPFSHPNNKFGVHILFPSELSDAAKLVNSNGGDWGYVTIPIQAGDKDREKWQNFFVQCSKVHIIPIIRLATEGDYFNTQVWRKPTYLDVLDFANFLGDLTWPTKNRYIIVFNEVNRGNEWGGTPSASEYADILSYAVTAFKTNSQDFYLISSGMDNASVNSSTTSNEYSFMQGMNDAIPGIFNQIDALGSHSYPNPAFSTPPWILNRESIDSFSYEASLVHQFTSKQLPVFITETGWSSANLSDDTIASYYQNAFTTAWDNPHIVAITPFLLKAGSGPFTQFSLEDGDGTLSKVFKAIQALPKIKGDPTRMPQVLADEIIKHPSKEERFSNKLLKEVRIQLSHTTKQFFKWMLGM